jgi:hypothetical protein
MRNGKNGAQIPRESMRNGKNGAQIPRESSSKVRPGRGKSGPEV